MTNGIRLELGFDRRSFFRGFLITLILGGIFVFLITASAGFSVGVPTVPLSAGTIAQNVIVVGIAPIFEEIIFGFVILILLFFFLKGFLPEEIAFFMASLGTAALFSVFHLVAFTQGGYVAGATPFVGAFVFRMVASYQTRLLGLSSAILLHGIVNGAILVSQVLV